MGLNDRFWMIQPDLWSTDEQLRAREEGWFIEVYNRPGLTRIMNIEAPNNERPFVSPLQAAEFVLERAHQGSEFHNRALIALMAAQIHGAQG